MLNVSPVTTRAASLAQVSDQSPQTFNESLLAASKASSSTGAANQAGTGTGRRQKPVSQDPKLPPSMPHVRAVLSAAPPQKMVQQQVPVAQQPPLINPALIPMQLPLGEPGRSASASTVAAGQPMRDVPAVTSLPIESKLARQSSLSRTASHRVTPRRRTILHRLHRYCRKSHMYYRLRLICLTHFRMESRTRFRVRSRTPRTQTRASLLTLFQAYSRTLSKKRFPPQFQAPLRVVSQVSHSSALPGAVPSADSSAVSGPIANPAPSVASGVIQKPLPDAIPSTVPTALPGALPSSVQASPVVPNAIPDASSNAVPAPVLHDAVNPSVKGDVASEIELRINQSG